MKFDNFLTRADDEILQKLLGTKILRLLRALDTSGFNQGRQRALLVEQTKPQSLLADKTTRALLLDLLRPAEAVQLCLVIGLPADSPYEELRNARISGDRLVAMLSFFELSPLAESHREDPVASKLVEPHYGLFEHQERASRKAIKALSERNKRVLLHMPTGAGKTRTAMHIIAEKMRAFPNKSVIWLAHSEELCEQAALEFEKAWQRLGSHAVTVRRFWGARDLDLPAVKGDFIVAGLPKMNALVRRSLAAIGTLGAGTSLVVIDEAHQAVAPTYRLILDALVLPFQASSLLGLSATPGRTWNNLDTDEALSDFFDRNKVVLEIDGYDNPVEFLIDQGYLARTIFRPLRLTSGTTLDENERERLERDLEIPVEVLQRLAEDEIRNLSILSEIEQLVKRHRRIIVFGTTVAHSDLMAFTLRARGLWARSVTGATPGPERQASLNEYKSRSEEVRIICNFGVLTTGFDAPETSAAVIARPTISLVLYSQMVGRAIRGTKAGGNAEAEIVTVVDANLPGFGNIGDAFLNWEDVWSQE